MFRDMISRACESWYKSDECTVKELISYISIKGAMRDAQIDAIKIYLFLKIKCENKPLHELFCMGVFNTLDLSQERLSIHAHEYLITHPEAAAFYEFCKTWGTKDKSITKILDTINADPSVLDYERIFKEAFYNINYTDYIFSLPMGAGKTFLMAAFIYLDLYFSKIDPNNRAFAENFLVIAPSGLKNSIVPSLRTIEKFNPEWVIDEASAKALKLEMCFDVLDAESITGSSNLVKNPNARKVALHLQGGKTRAVTLITNAEKVVTKRKMDIAQTKLDVGETGDDFINEFRAQIARIPRLTVMVDEAHHTSKNSILLREVISGWAEKGDLVSVIGFTGTPYLEKALKISIIGALKLSCSEINNVVQYYPLVEGIGNFLKVPEIKQYENRENYLEIVEDGIRSFFKQNRDFKYPNGCVSKLAVYCNNTQDLEEQVYPLTCSILSELGMDPGNAVLRYHEDKIPYRLAPDAKMNFETLDEPESVIRVILLVQIGKEGWDCRSLAGVILATESSSAKNKVLQTCCRCLRQMVKYDKEKAWIYLCKSNAVILETQLKEELHMTLQEFQTGTSKPSKTLRFYNRSEVIELPDITFYQLKVETTIINESELDVARNLRSIPLDMYRVDRMYKITDMANRTLEAGIEDNEHGDAEVDIANFNVWMGTISKGGFGFVSRKELFEHESTLKEIFEAITMEVDGIRYFRSKFDHGAVEAEIRKSFYSKRDIQVKTGYEICNACLIHSAAFKSEKEVGDPEKYNPGQEEVKTTYDEDGRGFVGREYMLRRYHYMPYHLDSELEGRILDTLHSITLNKYPDLEVYYNGDRFLTEFRIDCFEHIGPTIKRIGVYTPDFLILRRKDGRISQAVILETKGSIYANDPRFMLRRMFVENDFVPENNRQFGYSKFDYLYIQDDISDSQKVKLIQDKIESFFMRCEDAD